MSSVTHRVAYLKALLDAQMGPVLQGVMRAHEQDLATDEDVRAVHDVAAFVEQELKLFEELQKRVSRDAR